jgi:hypothetical protein
MLSPRVEFVTNLSYVCIIQLGFTANEGPVRIQYKCMVPIYLLNLLFPKQNYNVLSPRSIHISVRDLYISRFSLPILLQGNIVGIF